MADLAIGISKKAVEELANKVEMAIKEEAEQWQILQRDTVFVRDEFEMMQSFLRTADWRQIKNNVGRTWVRQVRDLSYDADDCVESVVLLDTKRRSCWLYAPSFWRRLLASCCCYYGAPSPLDLAVAEIKLIKARVEEVSSRNMRYSLINNDSSGSNDKLIEPQQLSSGSTVDDATAKVTLKKILKEAWANVKKQGDLVELNDLVVHQNEALQVISVWGTGGDLETQSIIKKVYDESKAFPCRAWLKIADPFNPHEFVRSMVHQFIFRNSSPVPIGGSVETAHLLTGMVAAQGTDLVKQCASILSSRRCLVVLEGLSNIAEWHAVRTFLPDSKNGSRIVVSTQQLEIARLCTKPNQVLALKDGHALSFCSEDYYKQGPCVVYSGKTLKIDSVNLFGRSMDQDKLSKMVSSAAKSDKDYVVSVWGFPGVGKSALVRTVLNQQENHTSCLFRQFGWVDLTSPYNLGEICQNLLQGEQQLARNPQKDRDNKKAIEEYKKILQKDSCLFVIDGLEKNGDWDLIRNTLELDNAKRRVVVVITRDEEIAKYCVGKHDAVYEVKPLGSKPALNLFKKHYMEEFKKKNVSCGAHIVKGVENLLSRCGGIPQVIVALAKYLATADEGIRQRRLRSLNDNFIHELERNTEFVSLGDLFKKMYSTFDSLPQSLRACILYLSVFPPACSNIRRNRFVLRWIAGGYSNCTDSKTSEDYAAELFDSFTKWKARVMSEWQINRFFQEYINSRLMEDGLVFFPLVVSVLSEENCSLNTEHLGQHLSIWSTWRRDESVFDNLDFSQLQSLTVFGEWKPWFVPYKMRSIRVLDVEGTEAVTDEELRRIFLMLPRLRFLSLRGHREITSLPSALYNLRMLQTLDIRDTSVTSLPSRIIKLQKLRYLRAGRDTPWIVNDTELSSNRPRCSRLFSLPKLFKADASRRGAIEAPLNIGKLTALHSLGAIRVNTASRATILMELKKLISRLRKLELYGISSNHSKQLVSVFNSGTHLEELTLCLDQDNDVIPWQDIRCLCCLWSLKLYGGQIKHLPPEIMYLHNLKKLSFQMVSLTEADIRCLGRLTELRTLRLRANTVVGYQLHFYVQQGDVADGEGSCRSVPFRDLKALEIACSSSLHIKFGDGALGKLEQLKLHCCNESPVHVSGLVHLTSLKKVWYRGSYDDDKLREEMEQQLIGHPNKPALMLN